jgi:hypothetical protein
MGNASTAAAGSSDLLKIEQKGAVLTVGLNRPAKRNALNDGIILAIQDCFSHLPDGVGAVVIHGIGDHFSSGLDLSELTEHDATEGLRHSQMWHRVFDRIQYSRVPVIAALKGAVIGGGCEMALAADIRVASSELQMALPEINYGLLPDTGGTQVIGLIDVAGQDGGSEHDDRKPFEVGLLSDPRQDFQPRETWQFDVQKDTPGQHTRKSVGEGGDSFVTVGRNFQFRGDSRLAERHCGQHYVIGVVLDVKDSSFHLE